jgi:mRNA interferase HigB
MRAISRKMLRTFWRKHPQAKGPLNAWYKLATRAAWKMFSDVKQDYGIADAVGKFVVFNIGGNKYRVVAAIHYNRQMVFVRHAMPHGEYDEDDWKNE